MEHPQALFSVVKTKAGWILKCSANGSATDSAGKGATNFRWTQQSHPKSGCY
jgi:hypothetical protein